MFLIYFLIIVAKIDYMAKMNNPEHICACDHLSWPFGSPSLSIHSKGFLCFLLRLVFLYSLPHLMFHLQFWQHQQQQFVWYSCLLWHHCWARQLKHTHRIHSDLNVRHLIFKTQMDPWELCEFETVSLSCETRIRKMLHMA